MPCSVPHSGKHLYGFSRHKHLLLCEGPQCSNKKHLRTGSLANSPCKQASMLLLNIDRELDSVRGNYARRSHPQKKTNKNILNTKTMFRATRFLRFPDTEKPRSYPGSRRERFAPKAPQKHGDSALEPGVAFFSVRKAWSRTCRARSIGGRKILEAFWGVLELGGKGSLQKGASHGSEAFGSSSLRVFSNQKPQLDVWFYSRNAQSHTSILAFDGMPELEFPRN